MAENFAEKAIIIFNHLRSNNYDVCTAAALCILNILDLMVLENLTVSCVPLHRAIFIFVDFAKSTLPLRQIDIGIKKLNKFLVSDSIFSSKILSAISLAKSSQ
jgi:hypothetical protein